MKFMKRASLFHKYTRSPLVCLGIGEGVERIVSAGKHLSNTHLSDLSIVGTRDIFVYR